MIEVEFVEDLSAWKEGERGSIQQVDQNELGRDPWVFASSASGQKVFEELHARFDRRLPDVADIFVGVQSSADDIFFVVPDESTTESEVVFTDTNGQRWTIERDATQPALVDRSLMPYEAEPVPDRAAIWPYEIEQPEGRRARARVIPPEEMEARFPRTMAYLEHHRSALEDRSVSPDPGDSFYAYGRSQSLTKMSDPKIVVRVLSVPLAPQFAWDPNGLIVPGGGSGPYYLMRSSSDEYPPELLIALLSHPVIDSLVIAGARTFRGGYAVHSKQSLQNAAVPQFSDEVRSQIVNLVQEMQSLSVELRDETDTMRRASIKSRRAYLRGRVEDCVSATLELSQEDLQYFTA